MMQDFNNEHVSNDDGILITEFPDPTQNPEARVELSETIELLIRSFGEASERIKGGRNARRRLYVLFYMAMSPEKRPSRREVAMVLGVSIFTVDKDIAFCRAQLNQACAANYLPPDAFENFVNAIG